MATVSILMPAYNSRKFLSEAIESIRVQTYTDWELIIVDDKSTDNTYNIAQEYANIDSRIKVHQLEDHTGSAIIPRNYAETFATGDYITYCDSDDKLEIFFIEKLFNRIKETLADAVMCQFWAMSEDGNVLFPTIPDSQFDMNGIVSGKEAYMLTIRGWRINGMGLFRKEIIFDTHYSYKISDSLIYEDELLTRQQFLHCDRIAFCDAAYYYRRNSSSVTLRFSEKLFYHMDTSWKLISISEDTFGKHSQEYNLTMCHMADSILRSILLYFRHKGEMTESARKSIYDKIQMFRKKVDRKSLKAISYKSYLKHILPVSFWSLVTVYDKEK